MDNHIVIPLAAANQDMGDQERLVNLYWALSSVLVAGVAGAVVELGCHEGRTSVFLRMIIDHFSPSRELHVYDSFQGLPPASRHDGRYIHEGQLKTDVADLRRTFARWGVRPPVIHPGWFHETLPTQLPDEICFAYLDGDFYESVLTSLTEVYPRLAPGAIAVIDDYCDRARNPRAFPLLPGPKRACDEFFADKPESVSVLVGVGSLAFGYVRRGWP